MIKRTLLSLALLTGIISFGYSQAADSVKAVKDNSVHIYFIINAGDQVNAFYNDKPLQLSTAADFTNYVQANAKSMKDSWVVVTGKPKTGTYDEVIRTLNRYRFKHVMKNVPKD